MFSQMRCQFTRAASALSGRAISKNVSPIPEQLTALPSSTFSPKLTINLSNTSTLKKIKMATSQEAQFWIEREGSIRGPYTFSNLAVMWSRGEIKLTDRICQQGSEKWTDVARVTNSLDKAANSNPEIQSERSRGIYIILGLFFGLVGIHNFYAGRLHAGVLECLVFALAIGISFLIPWMTMVSMFLICIAVIVELFVVTKDGHGRTLK